MTRLVGKSAIVTGAGRGIGRAIAEAYAELGASVGLVARTGAELDAVAAKIQSTGATAAAATADLRDPDQSMASIKTLVEQLGGLDILVNNAGGSLQRAAVADCDPRQWIGTIELNLIGAFACIHAALPYLKQSGNGKIINVGSGMGHAARAGNTAYNVSKSGLWMLTRCLAQELWRDGIDVNELIPGPVYTRLTEDVFEPPGSAPPPFAESERVKSPEECVPLAVFLATHPPGGPTGQSFSLARRPL